jgi:hypothetical protein
MFCYIACSEDKDLLISPIVYSFVSELLLYTQLTGSYRHLVCSHFLRNRDSLSRFTHLNYPIMGLSLACSDLRKIFRDLRWAWQVCPNSLGKNHSHMCYLKIMPNNSATGFVREAYFLMVRLYLRLFTSAHNVFKSIIAEPQASKGFRSEVGIRYLSKF